MSNAPNPLQVLRNTLNQLNFQGVQRAHIVGIFSNEWNKLVATSGTPETIVVNEDGVELAIERREDGKWQFAPTTFDGQRPRVNTASTNKVVELCPVCIEGKLLQAHVCNNCETVIGTADDVRANIAKAPSVSSPPTVSDDVIWETYGKTYSRSSKNCGHYLMYKSGYKDGAATKK